MRIDLPVTGLVPFYLCYFFVLQGIDYFENLCLVAENSCEDNRSFSPPRVGVPDSKIALHVNVHFYTDKELMVFKTAFKFIYPYISSLTKFSFN